MSAMPSPIEADFSAGSLPIRGTLDTSALNGGLEDDPFAAPPEQHERIIRRSRSSSSSGLGLLVTFLVGIGVTVAWYSFGGPVREAIAGMSPQLAWMAPQQPAPLAATAPDPAAPATPTAEQSSLAPDIDAVRQNVDRIATAQEKIIKSIDQLSAGQEQLTKEIAKLQAVEQYILYKNSEPPATAARAAPAALAPARKPASAPLQVSPSQTAPATPH
jgi:hypothetical protein